MDRSKYLAALLLKQILIDPLKTNVLRKRQYSTSFFSRLQILYCFYDSAYFASITVTFHFPIKDKSIKEVEEFNIYPNAIKTLGVGTGVVVKKYPAARAYCVQVSKNL